LRRVDGCAGRLGSGGFSAEAPVSNQRAFEGRVAPDFACNASQQHICNRSAVFPSSFDLVTPLYLLPKVDLSTPYLLAISLEEICSHFSRDFKSSTASLIGAMVVELSRVEVGESRRAMVFGGA
jgi:hypothetical protein